MTLENIDNRIDEINKKINEIESRPTEVYSRIVGYYRSVKNWNNGKSAEYKVRKTFMEPETQSCQPPILNEEKALEEKPTVAESVIIEEKVAVEPAAQAEEAPEQDSQADLFALADPAEESRPKKVGRYSFFYRNTCPNCPPVKDLISDLSWEGNQINVDEEEGLNAAVEHNVFTAPTVILFSREGEEIFRTDNAAGLKEFVEAGTAAAV
ncbi:MAG: anaerobic ribonucleoside-triphosphate reductase [Spirochaetales bacterium]|nr:anaerobic ribonucleoside-triphosphate reductase [Spirochaetales bacterium]